MIITLPERTRNALVDVMSSLIDINKSAGHIELLDNAGNILAKPVFSRPCAPQGSGGVVRFYDLAEDPSAQRSGKAIEGRIVDGAGVEVFGCDVSDMSGDAVIKINSIDIVAGGPVRISEFTLTMPER